jgi:hypothetical protein
MKTEEDIRAAAFAEAAELIQKRWRFRSMQDADDAPLLVKAILDLGKPKPDPRSRRITVTFTVADKWTYVFDRDSPTQVQRYVGSSRMRRHGKRSGGLLDPEGDILLYALEQEREKLVVREAHYGQSDEDAARLEHLNLFLDAG